MDRPASFAAPAAVKALLGAQPRWGRIRGRRNLTGPEWRRAGPAAGTARAAATKARRTQSAEPKRAADPAAARRHADGTQTGGTTQTGHEDRITDGTQTGAHNADGPGQGGASRQTGRRTARATRTGPRTDTRGRDRTDGFENPIARPFTDLLIFISGFTRHARARKPPRRVLVKEGRPDPVREWTRAAWGPG